MTYSVGIDLGTSRSAIVTSMGTRASVASCVGYPKDVIARKRVGHEPLLGEAALAHRMALELVYPLGDGVVKEGERAGEATRAILAHLLDQALPERDTERAIFAAIGVPAQASVQSCQRLLALCEGLFTKVLIVSEPFAVAYALDRFDEALIVDIGAGTVDICRMHGVMPEADDQVTLNTAGNFLDGVIERVILAKYPEVQLTAQIIRRIKEKYGYVSEKSDPVEVTLTKHGVPARYDITTELREACLELTRPIAQAVQGLVGSFDADFQHLLRDNIIIAGGGSRLKGIDLALERSLAAYGGARALCVEDAEFCGAQGTLKMCLEMPEEYWQRID